MLGKSKPTTSTSTVETQTAKIGTIIGPGAVFKGDIVAPEAIRIDGTLTGNCECKGNLILGTEGQIKGNIKAQNVILSGKVVLRKAGAALHRKAVRQHYSTLPCD